MNDSVPDKKMSLYGHLVELRTRLLVSALVFFVIFFLCLVKLGSPPVSFSDLVYMFLQKPLAVLLEERGGRMIFTALHEGFFTQIKVAFFISIIVSLPIILTQIWRFIAPGLYKNERKVLLPFIIATPFLFLLGASIVYYLVMPLAWEFFLSFEINSSLSTLPIEIEPRISEYLSLVMRLIIAFGLCFQLPIILLLLIKAGFITSEWLAKRRKYAILRAFIASAILTPPDVISQVMLATPIIFLYEISILLARVFYKK